MLLAIQVGTPTLEGFMMTAYGWWVILTGPPSTYTWMRYMYVYTYVASLNAFLSARCVQCILHTPSWFYSYFAIFLFVCLPVRLVLCACTVRHYHGHCLLCPCEVWGGLGTRLWRGSWLVRVSWLICLLAAKEAKWCQYYEQWRHCSPCTSTILRKSPRSTEMTRKYVPAKVRKLHRWQSGVTVLSVP